MSDNDIAKVMDEMPYGLYIVGSREGDEVNGMMADWLMQVSFEPRLVALALENDSHTLNNIRATKQFTVNALSQAPDNMDLAGKFAQPYYGAKIRGRTRVASDEIHRKLKSVEHRVASNGCPVLDAAMAWLVCEAEQFVPAGDHTLVIGRVLEGKLEKDAQPLTSSYTGWNYSG